jgi:hypothetical protein
MHQFLKFIFGIELYIFILEVIVKHYIIEDTATYPSKIVTKQQGKQQHCTRNIP